MSNLSKARSLIVSLRSLLTNFGNILSVFELVNRTGLRVIEAIVCIERPQNLWDEVHCRYCLIQKRRDFVSRKQSPQI